MPLVAPGRTRRTLEADSLGERSALANGNLVTLLNTESRRNVGSKVLVALLVTVVLGDVVEVVTSDNDGTVHLGRDNSTGQNLTTDRDNTGERALVVNVVGADGLSRGLETETNILVPTLGFLVDLGLGERKCEVAKLNVSPYSTFKISSRSSRSLKTENFSNITQQKLPSNMNTILILDHLFLQSICFLTFLILLFAGNVHIVHPSVQVSHFNVISFSRRVLINITNLLEASLRLNS